MGHSLLLFILGNSRLKIYCCILIGSFLSSFKPLEICIVRSLLNLIKLFDINFNFFAFMCYIFSSVASTHSGHSQQGSLPVTHRVVKGAKLTFPCHTPHFPPFPFPPQPLPFAPCSSISFTGCPVICVKLVATQQGYLKMGNIV